jgi:hypothetical protein
VQKLLYGKKTNFIVVSFTALATEFSVVGLTHDKNSPDLSFSKLDQG